MAGIYGPTSPADDFAVDSFGVRGPTGAVPFGPPAAWVAGVAYASGPPASCVVVAGSSFVCLVAHTAGVFALDLAAGRWGVVAAAADGKAAVLALAGQPSGIAQLDGAGRQPLAQDQIRAWQVIRAARSVIVNAGGTWSGFLANEVGNSDAVDGSYEAVQGGTPAPVGGVLAGLILDYLQKFCGQTQSQAISTLQTIWVDATTITA